MFFSKKLKNFKRIKHCFFSRKGGFSKGIYKGLNCGQGSKDLKKNIDKNLNFVANKVRTKRNRLLLMYQTHSNKVIFINSKNKNNKKFNCDALLTNIKGLALGVVTADCVPILIYDFKNQVIGCIHAGWKGASLGIIENTIKKIKKMNSNCKIYAAIGPCIGKNSYEVNLDFYKNFLKKSKKNNIYFRKKNKNKKYFNLRRYVNDILIKQRVITNHVDYDTYKEKTKFFSYRRSQKLGENDYGRCISIITLTNFSQN